MRYVPNGYIFDAKGSMCFPKSSLDIWNILGYANSKVIDIFLKQLAPTMDYSQGPVGNVPFKFNDGDLSEIIKELVNIHKRDWDENETSFEFKRDMLVHFSRDINTIKGSFTLRQGENKKAINRTKFLEEMNNSFFINCFNLTDILSPEIELNKITLTHATIEIDIQKIISYAIGCQMGRYSLDREGLVYAHEGNNGFAGLC